MKHPFPPFIAIAQSSFFLDMKSLRVVVSGAAGLIGYSLSGLLVVFQLTFDG